MWNFFMEITRK